jgi:hypothetical protein
MVRMQGLWERIFRLQAVGGLVFGALIMGISVSHFRSYEEFHANAQQVYATVLNVHAGIRTPYVTARADNGRDYLVDQFRKGPLPEVGSRISLLVDGEGGEKAVEVGSDHSSTVTIVGVVAASGVAMISVGYLVLARYLGRKRGGVN